MKVLIITRMLSSGGAERVASILANKFAETTECEIILFDEAPKKYYLDARVKTQTIGKKSKINVIDKIRRYKEIARYIEANNFDVVLCLPEELGIYVRLFYRKKRTKVIISERNDPKKVKKSIFTRLFKKYAYLKCDGVVFQSEYARNCFSKKIQDKSVILDNPIIFGEFDGLKRKEERTNIISTAGRLSKQKNYPCLIRAFSEVNKQYPNYKLHIYGSGNEKEILKKMVLDLNLENSIYFFGYIENIEVKMLESDFFVLSSLFEGQPNVVLECMYLSVPVICSKFDGYSSFLIDKQNSVLFENNNSTDLYQKIIHAIENPNQMRKYSDNAKEMIQTRFNLDKIVNKWLDYISNVTHNN